MPKMNVMDAVVRVMESEGVDVVFGVPGAAILPLYKALAKSDIRHVSVRHEEGGTHAADGYARVTGKVGVNIGTSGPAGTNKGPEVDWDPDWDRALQFDRPTPNPAAIREAVAMLLQAERPMLMPGGGVILSEAAPALMALADYLQIPVTPTYMGKGAIPEDHPLYAGVVGIQTSQRYANSLFLESDLILAVGARFADRHTGDLDVYRGDRRFIQVDVEPYQIGRVFPPD